MKVFYILKPDMLRNRDALKYYENGVLDSLFVHDAEFFYIRDWTEFSKLLYDQDEDLTLEQLKEKRKKVLTTILGYKKYFEGESAVLNTFEIPDDEKCLKELFDFKKRLRRLFVYGTEQHFVNIKNSDIIPYEDKITTYDLSGLDLEFIVLPPNGSINDERFNMIFFNKIHFPDPDSISLRKDMDLLKDYGVFEEKNKILRLGVR